MKRLATPPNGDCAVRSLFHSPGCHRLPFLLANHCSPALVSLVAVGGSVLCGAAFGTVKSSSSSLHFHFPILPFKHSTTSHRPPLKQDTLTSRMSFYCIHLTVTLACFRRFSMQGQSHNSCMESTLPKPSGFVNLFMLFLVLAFPGSEWLHPSIQVRLPGFGTR